ncbi:MAG: MFS transporter [Nitratireductor sp.]|nr:MFS transporter [Nitratireductor sp.]
MHYFPDALRGDRPRDVIRRSFIIACVAFLTLIDLFGAQAILPQIIRAYSIDAASAGLAVNAATLGMAVSGLVVAWFAASIDRKRGIWLCLALLSVPTLLLAVASNIWIFAGLRIAQGVLMAAAFSLTMTYLSERCAMTAAGGALAAYITGNVVSNLVGRLTATSATEIVGLSGSFVLFACLNLVGAFLAYMVIGSRDETAPRSAGSPSKAWKTHLANPSLRSAFFIGFSILFLFVGVFTYVNLHLIDRFGLSETAIGLVYLVFAPAVLTTPFAGTAVNLLGPRKSLFISMLITMLGLLATLSSSLWLVLCGLAIVASSTFFSQAAATGYISVEVRSERAQASGLYLSSYYFGGLAGALVIGRINSIYGWQGSVVALSIIILFATVASQSFRSISRQEMMI